MGNLPILGNWRTVAGVALVTSAEIFPRWTLRSPLRIEQDPAMLPASIEYKYFIRSSSGGDVRCWEDLGLLELPRFASTSCSSTNLRIEQQLLHGGFKPRPVNRHLPGCQALRVRCAHGISFRLDLFGRCAPVKEVSWLVGQAWDPQHAGGDAAIGPECFRMVRDAGEDLLQCEGQREALRKAAWENDLPRPYLALRSHLLRGLSQLRQRHPLPMVLWRHVAEYLGCASPGWNKQGEARGLKHQVE